MRLYPANSESTSRKLAAGLAKIGMVMRQQAWSAGGEVGLTPTQGQILTVLASHPGSGRPISTLAADLAVSQPTISDAVSALERKRLVRKTRSKTDARVMHVTLTRTGARAAQASAQWPDPLLAAIDALDAQEQAVFVRGLVKMIHALQRQGKIPMARMCVSCTYFRPHAHPGESAPHHCAYVDAPLGDGDLRLDCAEFEAAEDEDRPRLWQVFIEGHAQRGMVPAAWRENPSLTMKGECS